ncbi:MAG: 16S rRNA processing protein RimM [Ruminococcaceae bacterium]|nr:16S rRNA processing protein RimM [Oscillospiraceae bacterium]
MDKKYIECGKIINTHGCKGGLKIEPWCNSAEDFTALKSLYIKNKNEFIKYNVTKSSVFKQFVILELKEIDDMDKAIALKNITLYADREDFSLEDGEYFLTDIIGLDVIDAENGKIYGKVSDIINRGASDIYVVDTPNGERMIPAVEEFIVEIDINCGIKVRTIEGLLD